MDPEGPGISVADAASSSRRESPSPRLSPCSRPALPGRPPAPDRRPRLDGPGSARPLPAPPRPDSRRLRLALEEALRERHGSRAGFRAGGRAPHRRNRPHGLWRSRGGVRQSSARWSYSWKLASPPSRRFGSPTLNGAKYLGREARIGTSPREKKRTSSSSRATRRRGSKTWRTSSSSSRTASATTRRSSSSRPAEASAFAEPGAHRSRRAHDVAQSAARPNGVEGIAGDEGERRRPRRTQEHSCRSRGRYGYRRRHNGGSRGRSRRRRSRRRGRRSRETGTGCPRCPAMTVLLPCRSTRQRSSVDEPGAEGERGALGPGEDDGVEGGLWGAEPGDGPGSGPGPGPDAIAARPRALPGKMKEDLGGDRLRRDVISSGETRAPGDEEQQGGDARTSHGRYLDSRSTNPGTRDQEPADVPQQRRGRRGPGQRAVGILGLGDLKGGERRRDFFPKTHVDDLLLQIGVSVPPIRRHPFVEKSLVDPATHAEPRPARYRVALERHGADHVASTDVHRELDWLVRPTRAEQPQNAPLGHPEPG